jgi:hypothetical protein
VILLGGEYTIGGLFRTTARVFRLGAEAAPRCSDAVQLEAAEDSMEHEHDLTCGPFRLDATPDPLYRGKWIIA